MPARASSTVMPSSCATFAEAITTRAEGSSNATRTPCGCTDPMNGWASARGTGAIDPTVGRTARGIDCNGLRGVSRPEPEGSGRPYHSASFGEKH